MYRAGVADAASDSYESRRKAHQNRIDPIDRWRSPDHNVTIRDALRAAAGHAARVAPHTALMIPSPLVSVEGSIARPRVAPLDGVPPFGREWRFGAASGSRSGIRCVATLTTSCIDVDAPHRACRWQPLAAVQPSSAGVPAVAAGATGRHRHIARAVDRAHDRRARHAACWSIGALAIIGGLIVAHEPFPDVARSPVMQIAGAVPEHATEFTGRVRSAGAEPATAITPARHHAARAVASTPITSSQPARDAALAPSPRLADADGAPDVRRAATAAAPSPNRPNGTHATAAQVHPPSAPRLAGRPSITHVASRMPTPGRAGSLPVPDTRHDQHASLDDPLTLIAMANALRADRPAWAADAPAADFDWTTHLSHRRLTDTPTTLTR
ncbi:MULTISPECIES: hypothetical protein [unclassified Burkholderia]|uniref:hypothetical protein n=1 Tax=unclassified Burkholderia TaxID=2613784 RepID=UPI0028936AC9|nr:MULTISPECIES: hypothetical protein [unclassified Burkholderia]